jgi:hypothetical protein
MTTAELVEELHRLRSLTHALTLEIERLLQKVDPNALPPPSPSGRHSTRPAAGQKRVPSLQMPAVRTPSRPPKK